MSVSQQDTKEYTESLLQFRKRIKRQQNEYAQRLRELHLEHQIAVSHLYESKRKSKV